MTLKEENHSGLKPCILPAEVSGHCGAERTGFCASYTEVKYQTEKGKYNTISFICRLSKWYK